MNIQLKRRTKALVITGLAAGLAVGSGIAIAQWSVTSENASGNAKALTAVALTTSDATAATVADLYPGGSGDLQIKVTNANPYPVKVTLIEQDGDVTSDKAGCTNASSDVSLPNLPVTDALAAGETKTFTHAKAVNMGPAAVDACQGAVFTIPVALTGISTAS